jgi:hypothetical protein
MENNTIKQEKKTNTRKDRGGQERDGKSIGDLTFH